MSPPPQGSVCILLLQFSSLLVEHAAPHIHDSNNKRQGAKLRRLMTFAWPCLLPKQCVVSHQMASLASSQAEEPTGTHWYPLVPAYEIYNDRYYIRNSEGSPRNNVYI